jgi:hypothetical protein
MHLHPIELMMIDDLIAMDQHRSKINTQTIDFQSERYGNLSLLGL